MATTEIPRSKNREWGFYGTITHHAEPGPAWDLAFQAIREATGCQDHEVRAFLDSRYGRHFADSVANFMDEDPAKNPAAVAAAVAEWQGWRVSRREFRELGIPAGLPYLTGYVVHCGIAAEENGW